jgi:hypothetical protein
MQKETEFDHVTARVLFDADLKAFEHLHHVEVHEHRLQIRNFKKTL